MIERVYDDLPPDLTRLRTLRTWHALWLDRLDRAIAEAERRQAEQQQGEKSRPPVPDWVMEHGIGQGGPAVELHRGDCLMAGHRTRPVTRDQARQALAADVRACTHCRPDTALGVLE